MEENITKTLAPKLRFKFFNDHWIKMNYGDIYSFYSTNSYSRDNLNYESGAVKNIHYGDIHTKFKTLFDIQKEEVPYINSVIDINKIKEECFCKEKDLIIADASEDYADIGKTIELINTNNEKIIAGLHTFLARPNKHEMAKGFAGYLVQTWHFRKQVMTIAQGTKVLSISTGRLANLKLHLPSLPEQQKIASFLSAVDEKIQLLTRKKELLTQYKKGVMQQLFSGKLRFKDEQGNDFPEWEEKRLGEVGEFRGGGTPPTNNEKYWNGNIPWISSSDIIDNDIHNININKYINEEAIKESATKLIPKGSVMLISRVGVGKLAVSKTELCTSQDFTNFIPKGCNSYFLGYLLSIRKKALINLAQGTSIKGFTTSDVKSLKVSIPSLTEQQKIATCLSDFDDKIEYLSTQITQTQTFKKGLLQQMFV
jgi:type I restriction enzyme S subunit